MVTKASGLRAVDLLTSLMPTVIRNTPLKHKLTLECFVIAAKDVKKLLTDSGVECDSADLDVLIGKLEGKSIPELIKEGSGMMASMPSGGSGGAAAAGGAAAGGAAPAKEEEKPKEEEPEEDVDMGDLFGGGDDDY